MWARVLFSSRYCQVWRCIHCLVVRIRLEKPLCDACKALVANGDEAISMLMDLRDVVGTYGEVASLLGVSPSVVTEWTRGHCIPNKASRRAIWLLWAMICRPGQIRTVFDIITSGRYTVKGGPQHAGRADTNGLRANTWQAAHDVAVGIEPPVVRGKGQVSKRTGCAPTGERKAAKAKRRAEAKALKAAADGSSATSAPLSEIATTICWGVPGKPLA